MRRTNGESVERKRTQTAVARCRARLKTYRWEREKSTRDVKMMAELKKEKKEGNSQPSEKLGVEYKTNRLEERTKKLIKQIRETYLGQSS